MKQTLFYQTEIIAIDSGSTDESLAILRKYPVRIYPIKPADFNHGLTRNYGVELSRGEYIVMTVQDARPTDELWLQKLVDGFSLAENVAGVCGQQVVAHEKETNPVEWYRPVGAPGVTIYQFKSADEFSSLPPRDKMYVCGWDDVTAMYRKSILVTIPFQKISYGEDAVWAKQALMEGYSLVYNSGATVYHFHNENFDFTFKRALTVMYLRYKQFGFIYTPPKQSFRQFLSIIKTIYNSEPLTLSEKWNWFLYNRRQLKALKKAYSVFHLALRESEQKLDELYEQYCSLPPSPLKPLMKNEPAFS